MKRVYLLVLCLGLSFLFVFNLDAQQVVPQEKSPPQPSHSSSTPSMEYLTGERPRPLPFSDAVRVGHILYLSGQLGVDDNFALVSGGIKAETKQALERIRLILERSGSSLDRVVKCTVMLADMSEWEAMNDVYVTYFRKDRLPARSALGVNGLALDARVEIECLATVKSE